MRQLVLVHETDETRRYLQPDFLQGLLMNSWVSALQILELLGAERRGPSVVST